MSALTIHMFPCLADNYGYLLHDAEHGVTAAVDTPDAGKILAELDAKLKATKAGAKGAKKGKAK